MLQWVFPGGFKVFNTSPLEEVCVTARCSSTSREHGGSTLQSTCDRVSGCGPVSGAVLEAARPQGSAVGGTACG